MRFNIPVSRQTPIPETIVISSWKQWRNRVVTYIVISSWKQWRNRVVTYIVISSWKQWIRIISSRQKKTRR